jgi:hypothetical protein
VAINDKRRKHLTQRWLEADKQAEFTSAEDGVSVFKDIFSKVNESDFLSGRSGKWRASFDWVIESSTNFLKVVEGTHGNDRNK